MQDLQALSQMDPPTGTRRRLFSTGAAARVAGCHPVTILRAIERGELAALRLGPRGNHRVPADELARWLQPAGRGGAAAQRGGEA
jgi:excisionase family DNA binding protein